MVPLFGIKTCFMENVMIKSNIKVKLDFDIIKVWNKITHLENYSWRSDLRNVKVLNDDTFVLSSNSKNPTTCKITYVKLYREWEFHLDNKHFSGIFKGFFSGDESNCTIEFEGRLSPKKIYILPFLKDILKKQQHTYINDLKNALLYENAPILCKIK